MELDHEHKEEEEEEEGLTQDERDTIAHTKIIIIQMVCSLKRLEEGLKTSDIRQCGLNRIDKIGSNCFRLFFSTKQGAVETIQVLIRLGATVKPIGYDQVPEERTGEVDWVPTDVYEN